MTASCGECKYGRHCSRKGRSILGCERFAPKDDGGSNERYAVVQLVGKDTYGKVYRISIYEKGQFTGDVHVQDTIHGIKLFCRDIGIEDVRIGESLVEARKQAEIDEAWKRQEEREANEDLARRKGLGIDF